MAIVTKSDVLDLKLHIELLAKRDTEYRVFGSGGKFGGHHYHFLPALRDADVVAFEKKNRVELPDDYRQYLVHVADGGVGPSYGLNQLESAAQGAALAMPFPWTERTRLEGREDFELWDKHPGFLELCHHGCGYYDILVVAGSTKGLMWHDVLAGSSEIIPLAQSFFAWYSQWVVEKLERLNREPLIQKISVGMPLTAVIDTLGPIEESWLGTVPPVQKYVSFKNAAASFVIGDDDRVEKVNRFSL